MSEKLSVVVCVKNEEKRLEDCLKLVAANGPDEIIVVDGDSTDRTAEIARKYTDRVIVTKNSTLTRDRQVGIDAAKNELVAMIDADHRLKPGDLQSLAKDLRNYGFDIVQSKLVAHENHSIWNRGEEQYWELVHNVPGPRKMIGTAPAIYKKKVFEKVRFDDHITRKMDDTDFIYRLVSTTDFVIGIGDTAIAQLHFGSTQVYFKKFLWYGHGDGEFCRKHPHRAGSMVYHLLVRYPLVYSAQAARKGLFTAIPYFIFQGSVRFAGLVRYFAKHRDPAEKSSA